MLIYIAGPFRAPTPYDVELNVRRAEAVALDIARAGHIPIVPHTMYRFFDKQLDDTFWLSATLQLMHKCDALFLLEGWQSSAGTQKELDSFPFQKPVFLRMEELRRYEQ